MKIYMAGKITGDPNYKMKFRMAAKHIQELYPLAVILNPAELPEGLTPKDYMRLCFGMIDAADILFALPDGVARLREFAEADKDGRVVVLPCKVGERWVDEDGRAVRITAVVASMGPFGENINVYFDYEDATPDDAGSDCMANWDYFSRHYTCIEVERAMEGKRNG